MVVDIALAQRVEAAAVAQQVGTSLGLAALDPAGPATHRLLAGGALLYGGPGMYVNRGIGLGFERPVTEDELQLVEAFYDDVGAPPELELCPLAAGFDALLVEAGARGWKLASLRPTFVCDLAAPVGEVDAEAGASFRTVDDGSLAAWQELLAAGFAQTSPSARAVSDRFSAGAHRVPSAVDLIVEVRGEPAGVCSLTASGGVAWLGGMAILPEHRGHGLQRAALVHRLRLAREAGCEVAAVGALHGGTSFRNVQRVGFALAWTNAVLRRP